MSDRIFLDSNILIYCYSSSDIKKQQIARELAIKANTVISTQVLNETVNVLHKKFGIDCSAIDEILVDFEHNFLVHSVSVNTVRKACQIAQRYLFSYYDSLIISSALECGCSFLYSEDLHNSQKIENNIQILNPFI